MIKMTRIATIILSIFLGVLSLPAREIGLLIRGDDMGSTRASNLACINAYRAGILKSVEVMPVGPWFLEASEVLNKHPGLDVGIHLAITSEWSSYKWRPLSDCPSLVDENGYFRPMVWPSSHFPKGSSHSEHTWQLQEIESEVRAQIEFALKHIDRISHVTTHMGFESLGPEVQESVQRIAHEYGLGYNDWSGGELERFSGWGDAKTLEQKIDNFVSNLEKLTPGNYLFVEHPAYDTPEMQGISHPGSSDVGLNREHVTRVLTSDKVLEAIERLEIRIISYPHLKENESLQK